MIYFIYCLVRAVYTGANNPDEAAAVAAAPEHPPHPDQGGLRQELCTQTQSCIVHSIIKLFL